MVVYYVAIMVAEMEFKCEKYQDDGEEEYCNGIVEILATFTGFMNIFSNI